MFNGRSVSSGDPVELYRRYAGISEKQLPIPQRGTSRENPANNSNHRYGVFVLHLLQQPEYTVEHPSLATYVRENFGFDEGQWYGIRTHLGNRLQVIHFEAQNRRYVRAVAQIDILHTYVDKPFMNEEITSALEAISPGETAVL